MNEKKVMKVKKAYSIAHLMAQVLENKSLFKKSELGDGDESGGGHGYSNSRAGQLYGDFEALGMLEQNHANYEAMGFSHQAFVDVVLSQDEKYEPIDQERSRSIAQEIQKKIDGVIMVYTVFGSVDLRCKIVGQTLRDVEKAALEVRAMRGVATATTAIVIDDTDKAIVKEKMANLLRRKDPSAAFHTFFWGARDGGPTEEGE